MKTFSTLLFLIIAFLPITAYSDSGNGLILRPHFGLGSIKPQGSDSRIIQHVGGRLLLRTKGGKRYGLELTRFSSGEEDIFISAGIVLEQRLFNWFNMSIGTIGYFDYQKTEHNPVGLATNLGWEPDNYKTLTPFITYKSDFVFNEGIDSINSISIGFSW